MDETQNIIKEFRKGDITAFSLLYEKYWEKLYFIAYQKLRSQEEVEDIIQDLFIELWERRETLVINKSFDSYIFTSLKYKIFRHFDYKAIRRKYAKTLSVDDTIMGKSVEDYTTFNELFEFIEEKIEKLPKKCRVVFKLSRYKNFSVLEIAAKMGISVNTAQNHINKASKLLRFQINEILLILLILLY